ncbi:hypothetical protein M413DRAFT_255562 [Hebeloma cylindrosporum]|uniref:Transmembrane protein n=1 Tax=Hebeloma cylindrosporum TaxID=76867 RepID=A0A0C2Y9S9_HEBCY|nr:hypothetical protein M413DRAFT_255562 [Hebeloma cylindrosporum h7]
MRRMEAGEEGTMPTFLHFLFFFSTVTFFFNLLFTNSTGLMLFDGMSMTVDIGLWDRSFRRLSAYLVSFFFFYLWEMFLLRPSPPIVSSSLFLLLFL